MLNTISRGAFALTLVAGLSSVVTTSASAEYRGRRTAGIVAGTIIGLGVLGAYANAREPRGYSRSCYEGRRQCQVVGQRCWTSRYGEHVCKDDVRCYRPTICD